MGALQLPAVLDSGGAEDGPAYSAPRSTLDHLPTFDAGRKENALSATPWAGAVLFDLCFDFKGNQ
jgi:hypothetical protein